ncbi:MAG: DUF3196 family protein [Erysipelotrichaceae bacterium]
MSNYYDEILLEINELIDQGKINQALRKIENELDMPYIPVELEEQLNDLYRQYFVGGETSSLIVDSEQLIKLFNGSFEDNALAIESLKKLNLRDYLSIIVDYLFNPKYIEISSIMIELLINQNIDQQFVYHRLDKTFVFNPIELKSVIENETFVALYTTINDLLVGDNVSLANICLDLAIKEAYFNLPEGLVLGLYDSYLYQILEKGFNLLNISEEFDSFCRNHNILVKKDEKLLVTLLENIC